MLAFLAARFPATRVTLIDKQDRSALASVFGAQFEKEPEQGLESDIVFHTSASEAGFKTALDCAGQESRLVEMSWYGNHPISVSLGGAFHSKRLHVLSSQVGHIPSHHKSRWTFARRMQTALSLLDDPRLDRLLTHHIPFAEAPLLLPPLLDDPQALAISLVY